MTAAIVFDDGLGLLSPLTDLRPAFDIRTGALTTLERLRQVHELSILALAVPSHLRDLARERHPSTPIAPDAPHSLPEHVLLVSARAAVPPHQMDALEPGQTLREQGSGDLIAAFVTRDLALRFLSQPDPASIPGDTFDIPAPALLSRPWHVRTFRDAAIDQDLEHLTAQGGREPPLGVVALGDHPLVLHPSAIVYPSVTLDLEQGPIVLDHHALVRPGAILIGPCYVGPHSTVLERATIRPYTSLGPHCKANGEISGSILQAFANKAHDGFLGDSYLGEWVNLGANTTNSNLLNTYAETFARPSHASKNERTGQQFLGAIVGDHTKTAISTRIMTASILGTGSMIATSAPASGTLPPFSWCTDDDALKPTRRPYRLDKFVEVAKAAMARRKVTPSDAYLARLAQLHAQTHAQTHAQASP